MTEIDPRHTASNCAYCGHQLDASFDAGGSNDRPEPGDITLCIECGRLMMFNADLSLRALTEDEALTLEADEEQKELIAKAWWAIQRANAMS